MDFSLKDRLELRKLQSKMHDSTFGDQNDKIARSLDIDARWIRQSRLNYQYIFKNKSSFWPDWAKQQYRDPSERMPYPINELYCLNMLDKEFFSFRNKKEKK